MAPLRDSIGLTVPDRPSTPCDGRAQHYRRPGDSNKQQTRTFPNGTSLTFGDEDFVDEIKHGDAFFDQVLLVDGAIADVLAIRQRYRLDQHHGSPVEKPVSNVINQPHLTPTKQPDPSYLDQLDLDSIYQFKPHNQDKIDLSAKFASDDHINSDGSASSGYTNYMARQAGFFEGGDSDKSSQLRARKSMVPKASFSQNIHQPCLPGQGYPSSSTNNCGTVDVLETKFAQSLATLSAPGGGLLGIKAVQGFGAHRFDPLINRSPVGGKFGYLNLLVPYESPIRNYMPTDWENIQESMKWSAIEQDVLKVPSLPGENGPTIKHYRINPPEPSNHPQVVDLHGPPSQFQELIARNVNRRNMENYKPRPFPTQLHAPKKTRGRTATGLGQRQFKGHARQSSGQTSIFFKEDDRQLSPTPGAARYFGYSIGGGNNQQSNGNRDPNPQPNRRGRRRNRGARGGMRQQESRQPSPGRVMRGPPRFGGQTFNERIGINGQPARSSSTGCLSHKNHRGF